METGMIGVHIQSVVKIVAEESKQDIDIVVILILQMVDCIVSAMTQTLGPAMCGTVQKV
jgi:hypothetical protein